jgi:hypothetical protein
MFAHYQGDDNAKRNSQRIAAKTNVKGTEVISENDDELKLVPKTKERTVGYVIEKVAQWRRLYNGTYDQNFNH